MVESVAWGSCWVCAAEIDLGWWVCVGFVDSVGLGLCAGGFGSLPRPGVVDSVGLGLCRGLGWLNRWLGVVVGFALPRSAWGGGFALGLLIRWVWVFAEAWDG